MQPACVETCPAEVFHFGDANDPASPYSRFVASSKGSELKVLKPEEKTQPRVSYRSHNVATEAKIPKGRVHEPFSNEIETWTQTRSDPSARPVRFEAGNCLIQPSVQGAGAQAVLYAGRCTAALSVKPR